VLRWRVPSEPPTEFAGRFVEPPWNAPLDVAKALEAIPASATISGMFIAPLLLELQRAGVEIATGGARYMSFRFYPLREHARLLLQACARVYPDRPIRAALRKLGRAAPLAFNASTLGKVVLGSSQGVLESVAAMAKGYELNMKPGSAVIIESHARRAIVRLSDVYHFLDSHHVGAFEGTLKHAGAQGEVSIAAESDACADLLLRW
jgi:uncharacterized protein (TIGR02265 family)